MLIAREVDRAPRPGTGQVRAGDHYQDCQGVRPHGAIVARWWPAPTRWSS